MTKLKTYKRFGDMTLLDIYSSHIKPEQYPTARYTCKNCGASKIKRRMLRLELQDEITYCYKCDSFTVKQVEWEDLKEDEMIEMCNEKEERAGGVYSWASLKAIAARYDPDNVKKELTKIKKTPFEEWSVTQWMNKYLVDEQLITKEK